MKELRANDDLLRAENAVLMERNQDLKAENHEFKILNRDQLKMKEQLMQAGVEINRMNAEFRHLEEVNENARDQIRFLTEKLQIQVSPVPRFLSSYLPPLM
jgi:chromosome segregation ATPase